MALQRFTRRAAEAPQGTWEAKGALASMGIALRDQDGDRGAAVEGRQWLARPHNGTTREPLRGRLPFRDRHRVRPRSFKRQSWSRATERRVY
jgi:hypothetical protein